MEADMANSAVAAGAIPGLEWRVEFVIKNLYGRIQPLVRKYASRANTIELSVLVLSVFTSGAFWALVSDAAPKPMGLVGAAISTVVTGLTIYMYSFGLNRRRKNAIFISKEIGKFMADVRTNASMTDAEFWAQYKLLQGMIEELEFGSADS
jgi:hypothetical protein